MAMSPHVVLDVDSIHHLIQHVLRIHAPPSTLVVCSSKEVFLQAVQQPEEGATDVAECELAEGLRCNFQTPTLRLLSASRTLQLAFCPDVTHLRAYLATYDVSVSKRSRAPDTALRVKGVRPMLAVLNPIQLHRDTLAFSAQGLNRTFSAAVEAAECTGSSLILAEMPSATREEEEGVERNVTTGPWDEEVSILNVTTKRLGELSVGRAVKARTVAARWCTFARLSSPESRSINLRRGALVDSTTW